MGRGAVSQGSDALDMFKGFFFHFYPSLQISKIVRVKAEAAVRYGATIVPKLPDARVTHILLLNKKDAQEVSRKVDRPIPILRSEWVSHCIDSRKLVDTRPYEVLMPQSPTSPSKRSAPPNEKEPEGSPPRKAKKEDAFSEDKWARTVEVLFSTPATPGVVLPENQELVDIFQDMANSREANGREFSGRAYSNAITSLTEASSPIMTYDDAMALPNFGPKMASLVEKIREGRISDDVRKQMRAKTEVLDLFETVYGVGPKKAHQFYAEGFRCLSDIRKVTKDKRMKVSIDHHEEFVERISRPEVEKHYETVKRTVQSLNANAVCYAMGSYRRHQPDCGDIDIILTLPEARDLRAIRHLMLQLIKEMFARNFAVFTFGGGTDDESSNRWLGATALPGGAWRRMDILCVPPNELGAAMIYYTGNDNFNRKLRLLASWKGMRLNDKGLFTKEGKLIEGQSEHRIFEILGVPWFEASHRNI